MIVHPEFFPSSSRWEVSCDGRTLRASSLRDLSAKLPPGTNIEGYYPGGFAVSADARGFNIGSMRSVIDARLRPQFAQPKMPKMAVTATTKPVVATLAPAVVKNQEMPRVVVRVRQHRPHAKYDKNKILDLWFKGHDAREISEILGISPITRIGGIVCVARNGGDPRATPRRFGRRKLVLSPGGSSCSR